LKKHIYISFFVLTALLWSAQALFANQYRSNAATGNWGTAGTWQISTDGGTTWTTASNYPGQTTLNDTVLVRNGHTVTLNVSPANAIGRLTVGEGTSGALSIGGFSITVNGTLTVNNGATVTVTSATGTKTFNNVTINAGGAWNSTAAETYTINGNLTMNGGTIDGSATGVFNVGGSLNVSSGTNTLGNATITVTGATNITGALNITSATGTKTFVGTVTINSGGTWNNSANEAITLRGGIVNNGTFTSGTGTYTFDTNSQTISGTSGLTFSGTVAIQGAITITNQTTVTISGNLTGSVGGSTWLNDVNSTLNVAGTVLTTGTLNASADPNTVNYNGTGAQTIKAANYNNLTISGSRGTNNVTFPNGGTVGISGSFTPSATFTSGNYVTTGNTINFNGSGSQSIPALGTENYNNLTRSGTGTATLAANIGVAGNLTISGGTLDLGTFTANRTTSGGTLTVGAGATLRIGGTSSIPSNYTTHSIAATSTIEYSGGNQTVAVLNSAQNYGNLTISGTGTKTLAGNIGVAGDLTVASSALALATFTANRTSLGGTLTVANGAELWIGGTNSFPTNYQIHSIGSSSIILYYGSNQTIATLNSGQSYGNLHITGTGTKTLAGSVGVASNLLVAASTLDLGTNTLNRTSVGGSMVLGATATLRIGGTNSLPANYVVHTFSATSTVEYYGGNQVVATLSPGENYGNVTISGTGTKTLAGTIKVAGNLAVASSTLDLGASTADRTTAGGTLTVGAGATLRIGGTNSLPANYSTHVIDATSTIEYYGTNQSVATLNSSQNYGTLIISGSGTKTLAGNIGIAANLTISAGTLDLGTFTANRATPGGTLTLSSGAALKAGGSTGGITGSNFPANFTTYTLNGTVEFTGTGAQTVPALTYTHLIFTNGGTKSITASITATGNVTVNAGAPLVIASGVTFQIDGNFTNAGSVTNNGTVNVGN
jgi:hypothetical protein